MTMGGSKWLARYTHGTSWFRWLTVAMLLLPLLVTLPGCGGCNTDPAKTKKLAEEKKRRDALEEEKKRREELARREKPKPPFEPFQTNVWPLTRDEKETEPRIFVKPGHWMHVTQRTRANNSPFSGDLWMRCVNRQSKPIELPRSPYQVVASRPLSLPKSETREIGATLYFPPLSDVEFRQLSLQSRLTTRGNGREVTPASTQPTESLKSHQYFVIVLSQTPERYGHLQKLPTFSPPHDQWDIAGLQVDYIVSTPKVDKRVPLPNHPLAWTSLAYIFWDDMDPSRLSTSQQEALIDWLHWGGQLIVTSPRAIGVLRSSFLGDFLPASEKEIVNLPDDEVKELNASWSIVPQRSSGNSGNYLLTLSAEKPVQISTLTLKTGASTVPNSGNLVAEMRVGRGRIVQLALSLDHAFLRNWKGYDGFLNGAILRRPGREFSTGQNGLAKSQWANYPLLVSDARINTSLRYFCRDAASTDGVGAVRSHEDSPGRERETDVRVTAGQSWNFRESRSPYDGYGESGVSGIAGWSDFSPVANEARNALQTAAGISVPSGKFVASVLGIYLLCLVPLNWLFFRIIGHVEWAWFAAPVIAVVGAVGVIRSAHLDIGFVRSRTEIAVVEMQAAHQRAHISRFTGLYTSLSTQYTTTFNDGTTLALPFSTDPPADRLRQQPRREVTYRRDDGTALEGYSVLSNSTGMLRSESLRSIRGTCQLEGNDRNNMLISNNSEFDLHETVVAGRFENQLWLAFVGDLKSGTKTTVALQPTTDPQALNAFLEKSAVTAEHPQEGEVSLRGFYQLALNQVAFGDGDCRIVGWSDQEVAGMTVSPRPNQETFRTLVVAHVRYGTWGTPLPDRNVLSDFETKAEAP